MNENAFTAISFPFLPPHPAAYVRTHVACQVQPHMNFYKLAQRKKKSNFLSCVLSHSTQLFFFFFHFAATCSVNQGCQAEMAGAQAGLHWFSQRMRGLSAAAKRASEGSVVWEHNRSSSWPGHRSFMHIWLPSCRNKLGRAKQATLRRVFHSEVCLFKRHLFFREVWIGIKWCQHETKAWNI